MTTTGVAAPAAASPLAGRAGSALVAAAFSACAAGVVVGLLGGPLWLDEAISVEIARRPVPELLDALRQDGAPPLYYLLLHAWTGLVGDGTVAVRLLTVLLVPVALALAAALGGRLAGPSAARAGVVVLAALPWTMRYGSETRMYLLVVVLVLAGALALLRVRGGPSRSAVAALAACVGALLLTHYWSLFLLAAVAAWHAPAVLRREAAGVRVAVATALGGLAFLPWLPTFLFQAERTGAPWATPPGVVDLLRTPTWWGGSPSAARVVLGVAVVALVVAGARRHRAGRALALVAAGTLLLAWLGAQASEAAYTGRYTAVVVPLVAVAAGVGAVSLGGRRTVAALTALVVLGGVTGVLGAARPRASAGEVAEVFRAEAAAGDVLLFCPDQLGPPVAREVGPGYTQVVYPTLGPPELVDWVDYAERNRAASPQEVARRADALAGGRQLFVLKASGYRTYRRDDGSDDCDALLAAVTALRGQPEHLFGELGSTGQLLFGFEGR